MHGALFGRKLFQGSFGVATGFRYFVANGGYFGLDVAKLLPVETVSGSCRDVQEFARLRSLVDLIERGIAPFQFLARETVFTVAETRPADQTRGQHPDATHHADSNGAC